MKKVLLVLVCFVSVQGFADNHNGDTASFRGSRAEIDKMQRDLESSTATSFDEAVKNFFAAECIYRRGQEKELMKDLGDQIRKLKGAIEDNQSLRYFKGIQELARLVAARPGMPKYLSNTAGLLAKASSKKLMDSFSNDELKEKKVFDEIYSSMNKSYKHFFDSDDDVLLMISKALNEDF